MKELSSIKKVEKFNLSEIYNYKLEESLIEKIDDKDLVKNINIDECRFFKLNELVYDDKFPYREAFQNVLATIYSSMYNFIYVISGNKQGANIYFGIAKNQSYKGEIELSITDYSKEILKASFEGNFQGSKLINLNRNEIEKEIFEPLKKSNNLSFLGGVPSKSQKSDDTPDFQGIDRLINAMYGEQWQMIIVCEPVKKEEISEIKDEVYDLYENLHENAKVSFQSSETKGSSKSYSDTETTNISNTTGSNESKTFTDGENKGRSINESKNTSKSESKSFSETKSNSIGYNESESETVGTNQSLSNSKSDTSNRSKTKGSSESKSHNSGSSGNSKSNSESTSDSITESSSSTDGSSKTMGENNSQSRTKGSNKNESTSKGDSESISNTEGFTHGESSTYSISSSTALSKGVSESFTEGKSIGKSETFSENINASQSNTREKINKKAAEFLKYIDEELLNRLKSGSNKGLFKTAIYLTAENNAVNERLRYNVISIFQGDNVSFSQLYSFKMSGRLKEKGKKIISDFQIHNVLEEKAVDNLALLQGIPVKNEKLSISSYMTGEEISLIAGLPLKEIPGISLKEGIEFGLNCSQDNGKDNFEIGHIIYRGKELINNNVTLNKRSLNKHVFVSGITGSGKTTTCKKLIESSELPFLIIEPAKTEYREMINMKSCKDLVVYTLGNEKGLPFRFNPFEVLPNENFTAHIDMLKAAFATAFDFEASMPQILEIAIYKAYEKYGWDVDEGTNKYFERGDSEEVLYWPTLSDLIDNLNLVVKEQKFGPELEGNYRGSLISRIANLTYGSKGKMLNCKRSIDFLEMLDEKVVLEMEELKSPSDKSLMMALILSRLNEAIKIKYNDNKEFQHISLIEEAHRLLSKPSVGEDNSKRYSVQMFTDMLAEVRKYGESLIIVDQIPNKLADDVLKNTATKIIHKILAKDDKEVVGDTMYMNDEQKKFLSNLKTGEAIIFSDNWSKPVQVKIRNNIKEETCLNGSEIFSLNINKNVLKKQHLYYSELEMSNIFLNNEEINSYRKNRKTITDRIKGLLLDIKKDDLEEWIQKYYELVNLTNILEDMHLNKLIFKNLFLLQIVNIKDMADQIKLVTNIIENNQDSIMLKKNVEELKIILKNK